MNFNTICIRFGISPNDIENEYIEPIEYDNGFIYEFHQNKKGHFCPKCGCDEYAIKDYNYIEIKAKQNEHINDILRIKKVRLKCKKCNKTFTPKIKGINPYDSITLQSKQFIINDFFNVITFEQIAKKYDLSRSRIIQIFDENVKYVPRLKLPRVLCIDEFKFSKEDYIKYCCVLTNFETKEIVDIVISRQMPYLREYFSKQPYSIRCSIKYVITDMYDGYITIAKEYLPNATIAIDPFHYIRYFTEAVQSIRIRKFADEDFYARDLRWMKQNWRLLTVNLYEKKYQEKTIELSSGETISIYDRVFRFVKQDSELLYAVTALQDYYFMAAQTTYETANSLIKFTINRLKNSNIKELIDCAGTREHYEQYIVNSFIKYKGKRLSNGPIEGINSRIKALKKIYCGYSNFKRFFKRVIYIINKQKENSQKQNSKKL